MLGKDDTKLLANKEISFEYEAGNGQIFSIFNCITETEWLNEPCNIFKVVGESGVIKKFSVVKLKNSAVILSLSVINATEDMVDIDVSFPIIKGLRPIGHKGHTGYCFPMFDSVINYRPASLCCKYGSRFPLQFMSIFHEDAGGITVMTRDTGNLTKEYRLKKHDDGLIDMEVNYPKRTLEPGEKWEVPSFSLIIHDGDWHQGLQAYREWLMEWYQPTKAKDWLRNAFHFRRHFLHPNLGNPAWNSITKKYKLYDLVKEDIKELGGIDVVQLFDWAFEPRYGRVGNYDPWDHLNGWEGLNSEVQRIREEGAHVAIYFEGYLIDKKSPLSQKYGYKWTVKDPQGEPYYLLGSEYWYSCSYVNEWREYMKTKCMDICSKINVDAVYIDQYGYGIQYPCFDKNHGHAVPANQIQGEEDTIRLMRDFIPDDIAVLTEYFPSDVSTQYQDGSLTDAKSIINLARFAIPGFKTFVMLSCDEPFGHNLDGVKRVFFNGQGLWLDGPIQDEKWFPENFKNLVRKTYSILKRYSVAFMGVNPVPLVNTLHPGLLANQFSCSSYRLWTFYNESEFELRGELIAVEHVEKARYFDVWNGKEVSYHKVGNKAMLDFSIEPMDVCCIIQFKKDGDVL